MAHWLIEMSTLSQQQAFNPHKESTKTSRSSHQNPKSLGSFAALKDVDAIPQISEIETIEILTFVKDQT